MLPWSTQTLQEDCARDQPLFADGTRTRMTLEWVFRRLVRCQICQHSKGKGTWHPDTERGDMCA